MVEDDKNELQVIQVENMDTESNMGKSMQDNQVTSLDYKD